MIRGYTRALQGTRGLNRVDELTVFTGYMGDKQGTRGNCVYRVHEVIVFTGYTRAYQGTRGNCVYRVHEGLPGYTR